MTLDDMGMVIAAVLLWLQALAMRDEARLGWEAVMKQAETERNMRARARLASEFAEDALARVNRTGSDEDKERLRKAREREAIEWDKIADARSRAGEEP